MNERTKFIYFNEALKKVDFLSDETKRNKELARWAYQVVCTRAIGDENEQRIVPIADMVRSFTILLSNSVKNSYVVLISFHKQHSLTMERKQKLN